MSELADRWFVLTVDASLKTCLLASAVLLALWALRVRHSSARHEAWLIVLLAMLALPLLSTALPSIALPVPASLQIAARSGRHAILPFAAIEPAPKRTSPRGNGRTTRRHVADSQAPGADGDLSFGDPVELATAQDWLSGGVTAQPSRSGETAGRADGGSPAAKARTVSDGLDVSSDVLAAEGAGWPLLLAAIWLIVALARLGRLMFAVRATQRMVRRSIPLSASDGAVVDAHRAIGSMQSIQIAATCDVVVPLTAGLFRPVVLLPADWRTWSSEKLSDVLNHERTHRRRHDCLTAFLADLTTCLYWFHPIAWWLRRKLSALAEAACDDAAIGLTANRTAYARHLLEFASVLSTGSGRVVYSGLSMARQSNVESRINAILDRSRPLSGRLTWAAAILMASFVIPLAGVAAALRPTVDVRSESRGAAIAGVDGHSVRSGGATDAARKVALNDVGQPNPVPTGASPASSETPPPARSPNGTLSGRLVSTEGKPIDHGRILLERADLPTIETTSGADGRFRLGPLEPAYHARSLFVDASGYARECRTEVTVFPNIDNDLGEIVLWHGRRVRGQVLGDDGKPCANAAIFVKSLRHYLCHSVTRIGTWNVRTDSQGNFVTPPLPLGQAGLQIFVPGCRLADEYRLIVPGASDVELGTLRMEKDYPLVGLVVDEHGKPIEEANVACFPDPRPDVTSDKQGRFPIRGFGPGLGFSLGVSKKGYYEADTDFKFDDLPIKQTPALTITLLRADALQVQVVDADDGKPVAIRSLGQCDAVRHPDGKIERTRCRGVTFDKSKIGEFHVPISRRGGFVLTVTAGGYNPVEEFVPASLGTPSAPLVIRLRKEDPSRRDQTSAGRTTTSHGRLHGKILRHGQPVPGAWVSLWPAYSKEENLVNATVLRGRGVPHLAYGFLRCLTAADGTYSIDLPDPGRWYVMAETLQGTPAIAGPLTTAAKEDRTLDIACTEGGAIHGRIRNVAPDLLPQLWVVAFDQGIFKTEVRVNADGSFTIPQLPPGEYGLKVGHDGYEEPGLPWGRFRNRPDKDKLFDSLASPWKGAVVVNVQPEKSTEDVELNLPRR